MGETTAISWTDHTFNPWWGCSRVSPGCTHCYAETFAKRTGNLVWGKEADRRRFGDKHWNEPLKWNEAALKAGRPALVFCASMADVFEDREDHHDDRDRLWFLIARTPRLEWQLLTKRPENVLRMVPPAWRVSWPGNVWIGTTVEDEQRADERIPHLLAIPAEVRFLSCEPLLGPVDLGLTDHRLHERDYDGGHQYVCLDCSTDDEQVRWFTREPTPIQWVIVGGESGPKHRALNLDHARAIRDECAAAGVPFLFKQVGGQHPTSGGDLLDGVQHKALPARAG